MEQQGQDNEHPFTTMEVPVTSDDFVSLGRQNFDIENQISSLKLEAKSAADAFKSKQAELERQIEENRTVQKRGTFLIKVPYYTKMDFPAPGRKTLCHVETHQVIKEEAMSQEDRQMRLPGTGAVVTEITTKTRLGKRAKVQPEETTLQ